MEENKLQQVPSYEFDENGYTAGGMTSIGNAGFLSKENLALLKDAQIGIMNGWKQTKIWRSESEMRFSVLNDTEHPTRGMKYLQARLEQSVHFQQLMYLSCDYEEAQGELLMLQADLAEVHGNMDRSQGKRRILNAKIRRLQWNLTEMLKAAHDRVREVTTWERIKQELDDGSFSKTDYDKVQYDGLLARWKAELAAEESTPTPSGTRIAQLSGAISAAERGK